MRKVRIPCCPAFARTRPKIPLFPPRCRHALGAHSLFRGWQMGRLSNDHQSQRALGIVTGDRALCVSRSAVASSDPNTTTRMSSVSGTDRIPAWPSCWGGRSCWPAAAVSRAGIRKQSHGSNEHSTWTSPWSCRGAMFSRPAATSRAGFGSGRSRRSGP